MSFSDIDMLTAGVLEFYNSENASMIVAAMKKLYASRLTLVWLIEVQVLGRLVGAWKYG